MAKPLPLIPRKYIDKFGHVQLWDIEIEDGPLAIDFTGILAREALQRAPERYHLALPKGMKPGLAQHEAEERMREMADEAANEPPDPVFGRGATK